MLHQGISYLDIKHFGSIFDVGMVTGKNPYKVFLKTTRIGCYYIFQKNMIKVNKNNFELHKRLIFACLIWLLLIFDLESAFSSISRNPNSFFYYWSFIQSCKNNKIHEHQFTGKHLCRGQVLIWVNLASEYWTLHLSFLRKKYPFLRFINFKLNF